MHLYRSTRRDSPFFPPFLEGHLSVIRILRFVHSLRSASVGDLNRRIGGLLGERSSGFSWTQVCMLPTLPGEAPAARDEHSCPCHDACLPVGGPPAAFYVCEQMPRRPNRTRRFFSISRCRWNTGAPPATGEDSDHITEQPIIRG
jgi:hypothetical protein